MLTVPLPRPPAGVTAAQGTSLLAVQLHIVCVRTSIDTCPPSGATVSGALESSNWHGAGSSATATCCSPTTIVPWRATGSALAATW